MNITDPPAGGLRRPVMMMAGSSAILPLIGLLSAPILARGLGPEGRGLVSAAGAPGTLLIGVAALGLPEALTYFLAKNAHIARRAVGASLLLSVGVGALAILGTVVALPFLGSGDRLLASLIVVGTALALPQLLIGVLRGAAIGLQLWRSVALERLLSSGSRLLVLAILLVTGTLTPTTAVVTISVSAIAGGLTYLPLLTHTRADDVEDVQNGYRFRDVVDFGGRIWLGAIAGIVLSRVGQVMFAPLSNVSQLGLFVVGITIADVPLVIAFAVRDALYGVSSRSTNAAQVATTARLTLILTAVICLVIGGSLPLWIGPLFGSEFTAAVVPTWLLMGSALVSVPGYLAAAGLSAWGRPGVRSAGLVTTLLVYLVGFIVLVPSFGANGAGTAGVISGLYSSAFMIIAATRALKTRATSFLVPRRSDFRLIAREVRLLLGRVRGLSRR